MSDASNNRVTVVTDRRIPLEVGARIVGRAHWLRALLPTIDAELEIWYPPIQVMPWCWIQETRDGVKGIVPARVALLGDDSDTSRYVVQITAPALIEYGDDLVLGVFAHEYLHVIHFTLTIARAAEAAPPESRPPLDLSAGADYDKSWADYRRLDRPRGGSIHARVQSRLTCEL